MFGAVLQGSSLYYKYFEAVKVEIFVYPKLLMIQLKQTRLLTGQPLFTISWSDNTIFYRSLLKPKPRVLQRSNILDDYNILQHFSASVAEKRLDVGYYIQLWSGF